MRRPTAALLLLAGLAVPALRCHRQPASVERPEAVVSKRLTVYDQETYHRLAELWRRYCDAYPSEDAYGNWMKAARYAQLPEYPSLLATGLRKYPGNPVLLYLEALRTQGSGDPQARIAQLERALRLDPSFPDPAFALAVEYMQAGRPVEMDGVLERLMVQGAIPDVVLDYSYNMLASLEPGAILVTNGDNDTFPGWALTRVEGYRPDVLIVNRSLLNTEWYPLAIARAGAPWFLADGELAAIRAAWDRQIQERAGEARPAGGYADTLIAHLVAAAERQSRPVYFARTMPTVPTLSNLCERGQQLGLVTLVTPAAGDPGPAAARMLRLWVDEFRTGGLGSWRLKHAPPSDAGLMLAKNYAAGLSALVAADPPVTQATKDQVCRWFRQHVEGLLSPEERQRLGDPCSGWPRPAQVEARSGRERTR